MDLSLVMRRATCCLLVLLVVSAAPFAHAATPAVLIDDDLQAQRVRVTGLNGERISYFDAQRRLRDKALDEIVQLRAIGDDEGPVAPTAAPPSPRNGALVLTDGQRLAGEWIGASDDGSAVLWRHPVLGDVSIALDRLRGWRGGEAQTEAADLSFAEAPPAEDRVVLSNGDALGGFVTRLTNAGLSLQQGDHPEPITLPRERIEAVVLANPVRTEPAEGHRLVLADGSALAGHDVIMRSERMRFRPALGDGEPTSVPIADVKRVDFTGAGRRLVALTDCERQVSGGEVFALAMPPRVEPGGALWLHAPVRVMFELPAGARRVAMTAMLATGPDAPAELREWADFELILTGDDGELQRTRLYGAQPSASLNVAVTGATLRLELDAGANGPVLDRLRLRDGVVLVEADDAARQ